jgi:hypothetical protein
MAAPEQIRRREVFNSVVVFNTGFGRTDNHLPLGCEDTERCVRARAQCGR